VVWFVALPRRGFPLVQANLCANQERFHGFAQVRQQVPAVRDLRGLRGSPCGSIDIAASTVPTHDIHLRMGGQLALHALRFAIGQQIHNFVGLQIHEYTAEALAATPAPVIPPNDIDLAHRRHRDEKERPQQAGI
jgi:hypothetical protein